MTDPAGGVWPLLRSRLRLVGTAAGVGLVAGMVVLAVLSATGGPAVFARRKTFALGTLAFGFGLLGWSGSILAGDGMAAMQRRLETGSNWSEAGSRRAMARIGGFGAGMMGSVVVVGLLSGV